MQPNIELIKIKLLKKYSCYLTFLFTINTSYAAIPTTSSEVDLTPSESNTNHMTYFLLQISRALTIDVSVDYITRDDSAIAGEDYIVTSGVATISAGEISTVIAVEIIGGAVAENDESFSLLINNPQGDVVSDKKEDIKMSLLILFFTLIKKGIANEVRFLSHLSDRLFYPDNVNQYHPYLYQKDVLTFSAL